MIIKINRKSFFIFDLDDTLYYEIEFLKSGFKVISELIEKEIGIDIYDEMIKRFDKKEEVFGYVIDNYGKGKFVKKELINIYRNHFPDIHLRKDANDFLQLLLSHGVKLGLITDGRARTQKNKLKALGISEIFNLTVISEEFGSEKPSLNNFKVFEERFPGYKYYFFGDNINKDFISPNKLGWETFCLVDRGLNIHSQSVAVPDEKLPKYFINSFDDLSVIYE